VVFDPKGLTLEEYDNLPPNIDLNNIKELRVPLEKILPILPSYVPASTDASFQKIITGENPGPTISVGVGLASILTANRSYQYNFEEKKSSRCSSIYICRLIRPKIRCWRHTIKR